MKIFRVPKKHYIGQGQRIKIKVKPGVTHKKYKNHWLSTFWLFFVLITI